MKVEWLYEAKNEYRDFLTYYKVHAGAEYARSFSKKILDAAAQLERFPESGVLKENTLMGKYGFRALFIEQYVLIYKIVYDNVFIYHLADARTNYLYNIFGVSQD